MKQFLLKNKKIILMSLFIVLISLIIAFIVYNYVFTQKKLVQSQTNNSDYSTNAFANEQDYVKVVSESDIPSLKPFEMGQQTKIQKEIFQLLKTNFIDVNPNWHLAIKEGIASSENDFSQFIKNNIIQTAKVKRQYNLGLLKDWPKYLDNNSNQFVASIFDKENPEHEEYARNILSSSFKLTLKDNLKFENDEIINSDTIEYTLEKYKHIINQIIQDNDEEVLEHVNKNTLKLKDVVFEKKDDHNFVLKYPNKESLFILFQNLNNLTLLPPKAYEKAFRINNENITVNDYGTKENPFVSYGIYYLEKGYDDESYIFAKNINHFNHKRILVNKIIYEIVSHSDNKAQELFQENKLNEIDIEDNSSFLMANPQYKEKMLIFPTSEQLHLFFEPRSTINEFFCTNNKFRKSCFLAIDRKALSEKLSSTYSPSLSFTSPVSVAVDFPYNQTQQHQDNLSNFLEVNNLSSQEDVVLKKSFDPVKAKQLFDEVWHEYQEQNSDNPQNKLVLVMAKPIEETLKVVFSYLKDCLEECFGKERFEVFLSDEEYAEFNLDVADLPIKSVPHVLSHVFDFIKVHFQSRNIVIDLTENKLIWDNIKDKYQDQESWKIFLLDKVDNNNKWNGNVEDLVNLLQKSFLITPNLNQEEKNLFLSILSQIEADNYEKSSIVPLLHKNKIKIYRDVNKDFAASFLLGFHN